MKEKIIQLIESGDFELAEILCKGNGIDYNKCLLNSRKLFYNISNLIKDKDNIYLVKLAVFCSKLVLPILDNKLQYNKTIAYEAINAAECWINDPSGSNAKQAACASDCSMAAARSFADASGCNKTTYAISSAAYAANSAYCSYDSYFALRCAIKANPNVTKKIINYILNLSK